MSQAKKVPVIANRYLCKEISSPTVKQKYDKRKRERDVFELRQQRFLRKIRTMPIVNRYIGQPQIIRD